MAFGEQADQHPLDQLVLADDDALDLEDGALEGVHLGGQTVGTTYVPLLGRGCRMGTRTRVTATC
ncbi:hypothetical protein MKUB_21300 [Mycobacterium kubicae]|uniref:Uncharacterized protein n=1 Tax=Mycobacterium kubicae TaxID=120959 RepID=A0ABQ1BLR0_9MYCO|nr:hypothetical protein MKUB_21300 [Mycobacterium kubicae]